MKHIKKFNEEFDVLNRGANKIGKALSFGKRVTDREHAMNTSYKYLTSSYIKHVLNYVLGKQKDNFPSQSGIIANLKEIKSDLDKVVTSKDVSDHKNISLMKSLNDRINSIIKNPNSYIPTGKSTGTSSQMADATKQYQTVIDLLKQLYDITYRDGN